MVHAQKKLLRTPYHPTKTKASIIEFLQDLNRHAGTVIEYSSGSFEAGKTIELEGNETTIGGLLQKVLKGQKIRLLEHNNKIILVPSAEAFTIEHLLPPRFSFFGYIMEAESKETLINATIYEPSSQRGVFSNNEGYFNFLLSEGKHTLEISYGGLQPVILELDIHGNLRKDISLSVKNATFSAIIVKSENLPKDGALKLSNKHTLRGSMNGDDPLQSLFLSAGVPQASASLSGFQVRGGGVDENILLLDGNPVFNPTHLLGAVSIINPTVLKSVRLYKSDFPAKLSGSLSSVLDVYTKEGHMKQWHGEANVGLLAGALTLEGPLIKNRTAIMASARKNIPFPFYQSLQGGTRSEFYDAHLRMTTIVDANNKLALNVYKGKDELRQWENNTDNFHQWGNLVGSLGWNSTIGSWSSIQTSVNYSQFQDLGSYRYTVFNTDEEEDEEQKVESKYVGTFSSIQHYNIKSQAEIHASGNLKLNLGIKMATTKLRPFESQVNAISEEDEKTFSSSRPLNVEEFSSYAETEIRFSKKLFVKPGLHASFYQFEHYRKLGLQPRFFLSYRLSTAHKILASYARMNKFLHMVTNPYAGINQDVWVPATAGLSPEKSDIYNLRYDYTNSTSWLFSINGYYKQLKNVTHFSEGKSLWIDNYSWEQHFESGKGRSYGLETLIKKTKGAFFLEASYALSWSWRQFKSINNGKEFPYKYDHRHTAALGLAYTISPHLVILGEWNFASGNIYTQAGPVFANSQSPSDPTDDDDPLEDFDFSYHFSEENQYRSKNYQRYNLALEYHSKRDRRIFSAFKAGIFHVIGSADLYSYTLIESLSSNSIKIKTGNNVLKIMPYASYSIKF